MGTLGALATIPKEVYVAVIAAAASFLAAIISAILTVRSQRLQRDMEHSRFTMQKQLDEFKAARLRPENDYTRSASRFSFTSSKPPISRFENLVTLQSRKLGSSFARTKRIWKGGQAIGC
jgi:hypothetical protein